MTLIKKALLFMIIFAIVGELMIRFDKAAKVLEDKRVVKISANVEITPEYEMLHNGSAAFDSMDLKVMVIGDSYIHGGGIDFTENFSQNLKRMINEEKNKFQRGWVLDVSKPSSNNLDNHETYFQYVDTYEPEIVIIGYNINDIEGNLVKRNPEERAPESQTTKASGAESKSLIAKIYKVIYKSELIHYVFHNLHNTLKTYGFVLPGSKVSLTINSYATDRANWKKSKEFLKEIIEHADKNGIQLIIYKFPEINMIEHPKVFSKANEAIGAFFRSYPSVYYIDGSEQFRNKSSKEYRLSKYDGHPNEKAHEAMARKTFELIKQSNQRYK